MKKYIILSIALGISSVMLAQGQPAPSKYEVKQEARIQKMTEALALSDAQAAEIKAIELKYHPIIQDMMSIEDEAVRRKEVKLLKDARRAEIMLALNPQQREEFAAMEKQRLSKKMQARGMRVPAEHPRQDATAN